MRATGAVLVLAAAAAAQECPALDPDWTADHFDRFAGGAADVGCSLGPGEVVTGCSPAPCLAGPEWDALRQTKGLLGLERDVEVVVELNDWLTSGIQARLVQILVGEMLGYNVRVLHRTDSKFSFERLAAGAVTLNPEIWGHQSTKLEAFRAYVLPEEPCVFSQFNGVTADQKLYAPAYVSSSICESYSAVKTNPKDVRDTVAPPDGSTNVTDAMRTHCETNVWPESTCTAGRWLPPVCEAYPYAPGGPSPQCSELLMGSPLWATSWFEAAVHNLRLNYTTLYHPTLREEILRRYGNEENFVFYWYEPDLLLETIDVNPLSLPKYSERCAKTYDLEPRVSGIDCALRPDSLVSGINARVAASEPDLGHFHEEFYWDSGQLESIIRAVGEGEDAADATCDWLKDNVKLWTASVEHVPETHSGGSGSSSSDEDGGIIALWVLGGVGAVLLLALVASGIARVRAFLARSHELARERTFIVQEQTQAAIARITEFQAHFTVVPGDKFVALGALRSHEELQGTVTIYPTAKHVKEASSHGITFLFLSHQWLGSDHPDPNGVHYSAMCRAVRAVAADAAVELDMVRVWVDFASIPQKNRSEQKLAITSLPTFASCCDYFVVVAPTAMHTVTGCACDASSYRRRAWCRAEIMSCWARNNTHDMYYSSPEGLRPFSMMENDTIIDSLDVFGGDLTCCRLGHQDGQPCDREALMLPMLGLFCELYRDRNRHRRSRQAYATIEPHLERLYPRVFEWTCSVKREDGCTVESVSTQPLFGDLVQAAMYALDLENADENDPIFKQPVPDFRPGTRAAASREVPDSERPKLFSGRSFKNLSSKSLSSFNSSSEGSPGAGWSSSGASESPRIAPHSSPSSPLWPIWRSDSHLAVDEGVDKSEEATASVEADRV